MNNTYTTKIMSFGAMGLAILIVVAIAGKVSAAELYFDPQDTTAGTDKEFLIAVDINADTLVNALDVSIVVPKSFTPIETYDGNSIVNFWIDKPTFHPDTHILNFSGIIPGGFSGIAGRLLIIKVKVNNPDPTSILSFNASSTKVLLNGPQGIEDKVVLRDLPLPIIAGKENLAIDIPDTEPPLEFTPDLFHSPNINNDLWSIAFATQDKGSGINHYEIQETSASTYNDKQWITAESPYLLTDQELHQNIFVKAVDNKGNERIVGLKAAYGILWWKTKNGVITIFTTLLIIFLLCYELAAWSKKKNENI